MTTGYRCLLVALSLLLTVSGTLALGGRSEARTTGVTTSYVTGTVTDTQGRPVAGVLVRLAPVERETDFDEGTATAADGTYRTSITGTSQALVQFVAPYGGDVVGEFYDAALDLESATPVNLPPSGTVTGIDATLEPTSWIRGRVTDDLGAPLGESKIMFAPSSETGHYNEITTRSDGSFELPFARGSYRIGVQAADHTTEWWSEAASFADATDIVLGPGETRTINVSLTKSGFIRGRIVNQYGLPALTGVYAYRRAGTAWVLEQLTVPLASDGGNYSLVDLPPGTYRLRFGFLPTEPNGNNEYYESHWPRAATLERARDIVVGYGQTVRGIDAVVEKRAVIRGHAVDERPDEILRTFPVVFARWDGSRWVEVKRVWTARHAYDGEYAVGGLEPGCYAVVFHPRAPLLPAVRLLDVRRGVEYRGVDVVLRLPPRATPVRPVVTGNPRVGRRLSVTSGRWEPAVARMSYQWYADGRPIRGAVRQSYHPGRLRVGQRLSVLVSAPGVTDAYRPTSVMTAPTMRIRSRHRR